MSTTVGGVNSYIAASNTNSTSSTSGLTSDLSIDDFFSLLVAQMQNQSALDPVSDTEFIGQMAQFSTLQQLQSLQASFESQMSVSMIGKQIKAIAYEPKTQEIDGQLVSYIEPVQVEGTVSKVSFIDGQTVLEVNGLQVLLSDISEVNG